MKELRKKVTILFALLLSVIWFAILCLFVYSTYKNNLITLKDDIRMEIKECKWNNFLKSNGAYVDFDNIKYCVYSLDDSKKPHILFHTFPEASETQLLKEGNRLASNWKGHKHFLRYTYIYKFMYKKDRRYMLLISGATAWEATLPTLYISIFALLIGILFFVLSGRKVSHWLTQPVNNIIDSQKKFIANSSHELKSPLTVIRANTQMLQKEISPDNRHLKYIHQETERMISLVNKMLTLTHLDMTQDNTPPERFLVNDALYRIIYPLESVAYEKEIHITSDIQEEMYIVGIRDQIEELISILLNNAISYTPKCGEIRIRAYIHSRKFHLTVANTGDAIPKEMRDRLFERFFRADESHENDGHYGLGLSIASSITARHGGNIHVAYINEQNVFSVVLNTHAPARL